MAIHFASYISLNLISAQNKSKVIHHVISRKLHHFLHLYLMRPCCDRATILGCRQPALCKWSTNGSPLPQRGSESLLVGSWLSPRLSRYRCAAILWPAVAWSMEPWYAGCVSLTTRALADMLFTRTDSKVILTFSGAKFCL